MNTHTQTIFNFKTNNVIGKRNICNQSLSGKFDDEQIYNTEELCF